MANSPVSETIIDAVIAAIDAVTVQAGYNNTLGYVGRFSRFYRDDGDRPSVTVRWVGDTLSDYSGKTERLASTRLEIIALLKRNPNSPETTDQQSNILGFDVMTALTNIDYSSVVYDLGDLSSTPLIDYEDDEPADGVRVDATFTYWVDETDIHTLTGP
jgi:hypothetical protein